VGGVTEGASALPVDRKGVQHIPQNTKQDFMLNWDESALQC